MSDSEMDFACDVVGIFFVCVIFLFALIMILNALGIFNGKLKKQAKVNSKTFKKNKYKDFVGVEIECSRHRNAVSDKSLENFNFSSGSDASIGGSGDGKEYRSLPSQGDKFFEMVDGFTKELNDTNHTVNSSCGMHLHIETLPDLELIKKLYCFYSKYENLFFDMLPNSRQRNKYCEKFGNLDRYDWEEVLGVKTLSEFKKLFYESLWSWKQKGYANKKRYCWINFHSIFYRGTLEIRAHSGTINAEKIKNWALIHLGIRHYLNRVSLKTIKKMNPTKENFLKLFSKDIQEYIEKRWNAFPTKREVDFDEYAKDRNDRNVKISKEGGITKCAKFSS